MGVYQKLSAIQNELKAPKSQYNSFGKYSYRNCEDILEALKPVCKKHDAVTYLTDDIAVVGDRTYVKATAILVDFETGEKVENTAFAREEEAKKGMDGSQVTGASSSYARKYALNGLFGIDDTKDSDTTNAHETNYIDKNYIDTINKLIADTGTDPAAFLKFFKVKSVETLTVEQGVKALKMLESKVKK